VEYTYKSFWAANVSTDLARNRITMSGSERDSHEEKRNSEEEKRAFLLPIVEDEAESAPQIANRTGFSPKFWISASINTVCTAAIVRLVSSLEDSPRTD
jgi:hypothetical protein